jgi:proteasome lid subunit RPN8/RPN11
MSTPHLDQLILPGEQYQAMLRHVKGSPSEEACGLAAGKGDQVIKIYPITNALHSPVRFRMEASEQIRALLDIESQGWDLLAIYHSHLHGPPHPSETDTKEFAYPGVAYLIFDLSAATQLLQGYRLVAGEWLAIPIIVSY